MLGNFVPFIRSHLVNRDLLAHSGNCQAVFRCLAMSNELICLGRICHGGVEGELLLFRGEKLKNTSTGEDLGRSESYSEQDFQQGGEPTGRCSSSNLLCLAIRELQFLIWQVGDFDGMEDSDFSRKSLVERSVHVPPVWASVSLVYLFL